MIYLPFRVSLCSIEIFLPIGALELENDMFVVCTTYQLFEGLWPPMISNFRIYNVCTIWSHLYSCYIIYDFLTIYSFLLGQSIVTPPLDHAHRDLHLIHYQRLAVLLLVLQQRIHYFGILKYLIYNPRF